MKDKNFKYKKIVIIVSVFIIVLSLTMVGFSYFAPNITENTTYSTSGSATKKTPSITYTDTSSGINLTGTYPMVDEEGLTLDPYTFNVQNNEDVEIVYEVYLQTETENAIANNLVSASLNGSTPAALNTFETETPASGYSYNYKIGTGALAAGANKDFSLNVWLNEAGTVDTVQNKNWYGKIFVKARFSKSGVAKIQNLVSGSPTNTTDVITKEAPEGASCTNTLAYDGTVDNNLRYVGANPCNYVTFNGETAGWRIVGIMNNVDDGTGVTETRIKLVRNESLGSYSWDTSDETVNDGNGINDWTQADLKSELNGDYLNTTLNANTYWYNGQNNQKTGVFDYTKKLNAEAQELIGDTKWYLGGFNAENERIPSTMYLKERGTLVLGNGIGTCSDGACPRAIEWIGKVALMYPSDYGFATTGGTTTNRSTCIGSLTTYNNTSGESWTNSDYSDCINNDWLKPSSSHNWLLSSRSNGAYNTFNIYYVGNIRYDNASNNSAVHPAIYLKSGVTISGGSGTESDPYILS